ncbi:Phage terminase, small subunit [Hespellia stercorisuis DSM 15480]|uniref:Phage terminase, small subunit n=1 Tax=Hespellia stercorisuis DSM 15480 TaxID=1121950 RepID=A0A1M6MVK9_9FIRM|nr:Phage terminase, small subunit [Hespellia stercorisuis DSM 15480]
MVQKKGDILNSLISQLKKKEADISVFLDLIDDYMSLYDIKKKLKADIKKRGVAYESTSASGKATITKQNQSVKDLVAVNKQMLMILDKLGLTTDKTIKDDDDDKL